MRRPLLHLSPAAAGTALRLPFWARMRQWLSQSLTFIEPELLFAGTITNVTGEPLPFATIGLKGTRYETLTNAAGHFVLHIPLRLCSGPLCLRAALRGYMPAEEVIAATPGQEVHFTLAEAELARVVPFKRDDVRKTS